MKVGIMKEDGSAGDGGSPLTHGVSCKFYES